MHVRRITIGISGHEPEGTKIAIACHYASCLQAEAVFLHVNDPKADTLSVAFIDHGVRFDQTLLERYVRHHAGGSIPEPATFQVIDGDWLDRLAAASTRSDLLVLGHKHASWLQAAVSDSLDEMVINRAHCPVLVIPDKLEA